MIAEDFDGDGYPTDEALDRIKNWKCTSLQDYIDIMDFAGSLWSYPEYWVKTENFTDEDDRKPVIRYTFSTGGWSGNESVVGALNENMMVRVIGAWSWRRGGHYEFRFPTPEG